MINKLKECNINKDTVFFCIGTPKSDVDCLAPVVGDILKKHGVKNVIGTTKNPIDSKNVKDMFFKVIEEHGLNNILGIDACLSEKKDDIGKIIFNKNRGISPRSGIEPLFMLCDIGKHSIIGVTTCIEKKEDGEYSQIKIDRKDVEDMAKIIANDILKALEK